MESAEGVVISSVKKNSPAAKQGLRPGDLITSIDQNPITSPKEFQEAPKRTDLSSGILLSVINSRGARFEVIKE